MPSKSCHDNPDGLLVNTGGAPRSTVFTVDEGEMVVLTGCGFAEGTATIEVAVGPLDQDCWCPYTPGGCATELSSSVSQTAVAVPGIYRVNMDGVVPAEGEAVKIAAETHETDTTQPVTNLFKNPGSPPQLVDTGYVDEVTCAKVYALVKSVCGELQFPAGIGIINPQTGEFQMSMQITPAGKAAKTCERVDVLPLQIVGPAAAKTFAELVTDALAAAPVNYPTFGAAADTDDVLAVNAVENSGGSFLLNGVETAGVNDPDGVNTANTIEVPDGCTVSFSVCLQKCLTKAEVAAL